MACSSRRSREAKAAPDAQETVMVRVTRYSRSCKVCELAKLDRERIEAALLARLGSGELTAEYPGLGKYHIRQHEKECLPRLLKGRRTSA
jgi:hypothetical protein